MPTATEQLFVRIGIDLAELRRGLEQAGRELVGFAERNQAGLRTLGLAATAAGAAITGALALSVRAAIAAQEQNVRLAASLRAAGVDFAAVEARTTSWLSSLERLSGFADEQLAGALARAVQITGDYETGLRVVEVATQLARGAGMELAQATMLVGRAAAGSTEMLRRQGIFVREGASGMEALDAISSRFAGSAEARMATAAGAVDRFRNSVDNAGEALGNTFLPTITAVLNAAAGLAEAFNRLPTPIQGTAAAAGLAAGLLLGVTGPALLLVAQLPNLARGFHLAAAGIAAMRVALVAALPFLALAAGLLAIFAGPAAAAQKVKDLEDRLAALQAVGKISEAQAKTLFQAWVRGAEDAKRAVETFLRALETAAPAPARPSLVGMTEEEIKASNEITKALIQQWEAGQNAIAEARAEAARFAAEIDRLNDESLARHAESIQFVIEELQELGRAWQGAASEASRFAGIMGQTTPEAAAAAKRVLEETARMIVEDLAPGFEFTKDQMAALVAVLETRGPEAARELARYFSELPALLAEMAKTTAQAGNAWEDYFNRQRGGAAAAAFVVATEERRKRDELEATQRALRSSAEGWGAWAQEVAEQTKTMDLDAAIRFLEAMIDQITALGPAAAAAIVPLVNLLQQLRGQVTDTAQQIRQSIGRALLDSFQRFFEEVLTSAKTFGEALTGFFRSLVNAVISILARLAALQILKWLGFSIAGLQTGGVLQGAALAPAVAAQGGGAFTRPTLAFVAERPGTTELALPLPPGLRAEALAKAVSGPREAVIQLTIHNVIGDPRALGLPGAADMIGAVVNDISRRGPTMRSIRATLG